MNIDWSFWSSWAMTALSLGITGILLVRTKRVERRNREIMMLLIEDANYVSFEHELLDVIAEKLNDHRLMRYLVSSHQRGCCMYRWLVDYFLWGQAKVTYDDLRRFCQTPLITYKWQEEFWRGRLILRPENATEKVPEPFLVENRARRYDTYIKDTAPSGGEHPE